MDKSEEIARADQRREPERHRRDHAHARPDAGGRPGRHRSRQADDCADARGIAPGDQGRDRGIQADGGGDRRRNDGDAHHAALRLHRAVRTPARGQYPAAGSAQRRSGEHELDRAHHGDARFRIRRRHERPDQQERRDHRQGGTASRHVQHRHRQSAARSRRPRRPVHLARPRRSPTRSSCSTRATGETDDSIATRHANIEALVSTLDARTEDFGQRLQRFSGLLDESLDTATARAREIAGIIAETSNESVQTIEQQYELVRKTSDEERAAHQRGAQLGLRRGLRRSAGHVQPDRRPLHRDHAGHEADGGGNAAASSRRRAPSCAAAFSNCRRRPPRARRKCAASSSIRSRPWPNSIASSPATAVRSIPPSRCGARPNRSTPPAAAAARPARCGADVAPPAAASAAPRATSPARRRGEASPPTLSPVQGGKDEDDGPQRRLAVRSAHARFARRQSVDCTARRPRAVAERSRVEERPAARQRRFDRFAFGRYRADDRPRSRRRPVGTL